MEERIDELERRLLLVEGLANLFKERIAQLEKPFSQGRKISMLPVAVRGFYPLRTADQSSPDDVLLAVTVEEQDLQAPVIRIPRSKLSTLAGNKVGATITLTEYTQLPEMAQKKHCLSGGWEWQLLA
jgi:hypothetical protein